MDEKKYKLICVRKGKTHYARTNNRKNVTLGSYTNDVAMKGKASASIFSFQGHIIILRLLSFFIKLFIRFISNSPDFKIWILWLQKRPNQSPLIAKLYHYTIPRPLGKYCGQCQRHSLYVFQRFCLFVLKEKKILMKIGS